MFKLYFGVLVFLTSVSSFAFNIKVLNNSLDEESGSYNVSYVYENAYTDDFLFVLSAQNINEKLEIAYSTINFSSGFEVDSGTVSFPKTEIKQLQLLQKSQGVMFKAEDPTGGVIRLHGSEGGMSSFSHAKSLFMALNGLDTYAYCYFNCPFSGEPDNLHRVDVSKVYDAMVEMKNEYKVAFWGGSRGAELTAILSSFLVSNNLVEADAYIADRPAHVVVPAFFYYYQDPANWLNGEVGKPPIDETWIGSEDGPHIQKQGWIWSHDSALEFTNFSPIEIEHNQSPYLNIHGTADQIWPAQFSEVLESRVDDSIKDNFVYTQGDSFELSQRLFQFHYFEEVGHAFSAEWAQVLRAKLELEFLNQNLIL